MSYLGEFASSMITMSSHQLALEAVICERNGCSVDRNYDIQHNKIFRIDFF